MIGSRREGASLDHCPRFDDPVVFPSLTGAALTDRICAIALA